jgi:hypothetical protein
MQPKIFADIERRFVGKIDQVALLMQAFQHSAGDLLSLVPPPRAGKYPRSRDPWTNRKAGSGGIYQSYTRVRSVDGRLQANA